MKVDSDFQQLPYLHCSSSFFRSTLIKHRIENQNAPETQLKIVIGVEQHYNRRIQKSDVTVMRQRKPSSDTKNKTKQSC